jgi:hypothetical protein
MRLPGAASDQKKNAKAATTCQRLATKDVPYPHGSDEGILFLSSFTVVAVVSISLSVSVEESMVCKTDKFKPAR